MTAPTKRESTFGQANDADLVLGLTSNVQSGDLVLVSHSGNNIARSAINEPNELTWTEYCVYSDAGTRPQQRIFATILPVGGAQNLTLPLTMSGHDHQGSAIVFVGAPNIDDDVGLVGSLQGEHAASSVNAPDSALLVCWWQTRSSSGTSSYNGTPVSMTVLGEVPGTSLFQFADELVSAGATGTRTADQDPVGDWDQYSAASMVLTQASTTHDADTTMATSVDLSADAAVESDRTVALTTSVSLTAEAERIAEAATTLGPMVSLTADADRVTGATTALNVTTSLTADAQVEAQRSTALGVTTALTADAQVEAQRSTALGVTTALTADAQVEAEGSVTLGVTAGLSADASRETSATTLMGVTSTLSANATVVSDFVPGGCTLVVAAQDRLFEIASESRTMIVFDDPRVLYVARC